jgi:hypothetical protein
MVIAVRTITVSCFSRVEMMSTNTYVVLDISPAAHAEIKAKLLAGGYQHAIDGDTIDMHGIALEPSCEVCTPAESGADQQGRVPLKSIYEHYPEGILIDSKGNLSGDPAEIARFKEFARVIFRG